MRPDDLLSGLLFQLRDLGGKVAFEQMGIVPLEFLQGLGADVLRHAVEPVREPFRVLPAGPRGREALVCNSSQEECARGEGLVKFEFPDLLVPVRKRPFLRGLDYAVQRHEQGRRQPPHSLTIRGDWRVKDLIFWLLPDAGIREGRVKLDPRP